MEYKPSLPEDNVNVSHSRPLREFLEIGVSLAVIGLIVFWCAGLLVDTVVDEISPKTEASLNEMMRVPRPETAKPLLPQEAQLQTLLVQLERCSRLPGKTDLMLAGGDAVNAAVIPGGRMIVFEGLLKEIKSENGLVFVLAHELAHLEHRDHLRGMGRGIVLATLSVLLTGGDGDIAQILTPAAGAGNATFSRTQEAAADARALQMLQCRYGHAGGATELFELLKKEDDGVGFSHFMASHPALDDRIAALRAAITAQGLQVQPVLPFTRAAPAR